MNVPNPVFMEVSDRFCKRFPNLLQRGFQICYKDVHVVIGADSTETYTTQRLIAAIAELSRHRMRVARKELSKPQKRFER